ncbi:hypothetical protein GCM10009841_10660 [Microlunatus panaciterrae]|uniref:Superfamily II DNA/RNA helicase n=1 Tax=Microlunatus panaciterrae TaxID=400768 RepID=A0ABS2RKU0_9ACTN|nr:DEAD/DEAH box helicase [Microlunatus panaciterrae]MBM7799625.1 superfamily II DNA/RNA helicase [Microlunatus panaciterrae]
MPTNSGAPARASSKSKKSGPGAPKKARKVPKSFKVDGTPKKRWSSAERADRGLGPRKSGGQPNRAQRRREQFGAPVTSAGAERPRFDRESDDRPARDKTPRGDNRSRSDERPRFDRKTDERPRFDRNTDERPRFDRNTDERPRFDRNTDERPRFDRKTDERPRFDRKTDERPRFDRNTDERPRFERSGDDRPRYDRTKPELSRQTRSERPRHEAGSDRWRSTRDSRTGDNRPADNRSGGWRDDRGSRDNRSAGFSRGTDRPARSDSGESNADTMSWTARELAPVDTGAVTAEHGFARLGLPKPLVAALISEGITDPFPIQAATIPDALAGRDVLGRGQTGSGKTLGFALPMLTTLGGPAKGNRAPRGLVLVPTRELAMQVADVIAPLAKTMDMSVTLIAGGMAYGPQIRAFERGVDVVVATPGRLIDLMEQGALDLSRVEVAVLDEADHMADLGFMPAVTTIMDQMPAGGQRLLFSATLDRAVDRLVKKYLDNPVTHEVDSGQATVSTMVHHVVHILPHDKNALTAEIAGRPGRTVIFVRTQRGADRVAEQLRAAGVTAGALHGGLTQGARTRILAAFKDGTVPVLVATDVAARGIHVDDVGLVLQVDPPAGPKEYLHRAGRTARAGGTGVVVTLALPHQRKELQRLTSQAGVASAPLEARPGDEALARATGSRQPSGAAVSQADFEKLIAPPARGGGRPKNRKDFGRRDAGGYRGGNRRGTGGRSRG